MAEPRLSVQLSTVREELEADVDGTLARLAALGLTTVEAFGFVGRARELARAFARCGLEPTTGHANFLSDELHLGDGVMALPPAEVVLDEARTLGLDVVIDPIVAPDRWGDADAVARTADRLNAAAATAADLGLRVGYHNHSHEFHATIEGVTAFEYFAARLDDRVVLELDVFWAATAHQDVPALLGRLGPRVRALHVKDGVVGADPFLALSDFDPTHLDQRPAGQGELAVLDILAAAHHAELAVIEFDHAPGDVFDAIGASVDFLRDAGLR